MRAQIFKQTWIFLAATLLFVACTTVLSQSQTTGRIVGTVKDQKGAVIVGAAVTISSDNIADERHVETDAQGTFLVPSLRPGAYLIRVTANGFAVGWFNARVNITETIQVDAEPVSPALTVLPSM